MRITQKIQQEMQTFKMKIIRSSGSEFGHFDTIKKINLHREGKFHNCDDPNSIFWALGNPRHPHFAKKLGLDLKHFNPVALGDRNQYSTWILRMRYRKWAEETDFSIDIDDMNDTLSDYGSVVMKLVPVDDETEVTKYDWKVCDFTRLYFNTAVRPIYKSPTIEIHELTEYELRNNEAWMGYLKKNGKTIKDVLEAAEKVNGSNNDNQAEQASNEGETMIQKYKIYQRVGEFFFDNYENEDFSQHCIDPDDKPHVLNGYYCGSGDKEIVLFEGELDEVEESPYTDLHLDRYTDRFLGVGVYERLFTPQKQANELVNYNHTNNAIASLLLIYSGDKKIVGSNLIQDLISGRVLDSRLEQMQIKNTFIADFLNQLMAIEKQADDLCMMPEPGDDTVRGKILDLNEVTSAFRSARTRIYQPMVKVMKNKLMPSQVAKWNKEDILTIANDEIDVQLYDEIVIRYKLNKFIAREWASGKNPTEEDKKAFIDDLIAKFDREGRIIEDMKDFFNFDYGFTIDHFNEFENIDQKNQIRQFLIGTMLTNPAAANMPLFRQHAEENGIAAHKLTANDMSQLMQASTKAPQPAESKPDGMLSQVKQNG